MKTYFSRMTAHSIFRSAAPLWTILSVALVGLLGTMPLVMSAAGLQAAASTSTGESAGADVSARAEAEAAAEDVERSNDEERAWRKALPYLGIATTEVSEELSAQLDLKAGAGL